MAVNVEGIYNLTEPVILAHPHLLEAKSFMLNGKPVGEAKFKAQFAFEPASTDLGALKKLALQVARARFPNRDIVTEAKAGTFHFPFADGTKEADKLLARGKKSGDWQRGKILMSSSSKFDVKLGGIENGVVVDYDGDVRAAKARSKFFFGALVLAQFNLSAYEGGQGPDGVTAYLNMVFSTGKGTRIAGGASASEVFKGFQGTLSAEDPTGTAVADEILF